MRSMEKCITLAFDALKGPVQQYVGFVHDSKRLAVGTRVVQLVPNLTRRYWLIYVKNIRYRSAANLAKYATKIKNAFLSKSVQA